MPGLIFSQRIKRKSHDTEITLERSEAVGKYFTQTPSKPEEPGYLQDKALMITGGILLFIGLILCWQGDVLFKILGAVVGFFAAKTLIWRGITEYSEARKEYKEVLKQYRMAYENAEPKPSDKQMDRWQKEDLRKITAEARTKLWLENEDLKNDFLIIGGPSGSEKNQYALGKDGKIRYSRLNILFVHLAEYHIATYRCLYTFSNGLIINDATREFPYKEITNFELKTINQHLSIINGQQDFESGLQQFALYTSGRNIIKVIYAFSKDSDPDGALVRIGSEETISVIRKKLAEHKM